jgi:integrase/recombinase XerD
MTTSRSIYPSYYPTDWIQSVHSSSLSFLFPLDDHANPDAESIRTLFAPSTGAFFVYEPTRRRRAVNKATDRLEASSLPGFEYVISYIYDKYRRHHSVSSISQTGRTLHAFLSFCHDLGRRDIKEIQRKDIAAYVEREQESGLKVNSVRNHLHTVYAYFRYLVENEVVPADVLQKKIRIKLPEVLPKAIPTEDLTQILRVITGERDRALILLLLHTGMRIGELLKVKMADIILSERKILPYLGEKNFHGRTVFYSTTAELALNKWLATRDKTSEYLFYGYAGKPLCYVAAWMKMKDALQNAGLETKGYSLHSLRHTFATNMLNAGLRLEVLQQLLGHLSIEITLRYARIADVTREDAYFRAMAIIEKGISDAPNRINPELQAVFEEKNFL